MTATYTQSDRKTSVSSYMSIAVLNTSNPVITDCLYSHLDDYVKANIGGPSQGSVMKNSDTQLGIMLHDAPEVLDRLVESAVFKGFGSSYLPSGTMGSVKYVSLTGMLKAPFRRKLPVKKNSMMHLYKK